MHSETFIIPEDLTHWTQLSPPTPPNHNHRNHGPRRPVLGLSGRPAPGAMSLLAAVPPGDRNLVVPPGDWCFMLVEQACATVRNRKN